MNGPGMAVRTASASVRPWKGMQKKIKIIVVDIFVFPLLSLVWVINERSITCYNYAPVWLKTPPQGRLPRTMETWEFLRNIKDTSSLWQLEILIRPSNGKFHLLVHLQNSYHPPTAPARILPLPAGCSSSSSSLNPYKLKIDALCGTRPRSPEL